MVPLQSHIEHASDALGVIGSYLYPLESQAPVPCSTTSILSVPHDPGAPVSHAHPGEPRRRTSPNNGVASAYVLSQATLKDNEEIENSPSESMGV